MCEYKSLTGPQCAQVLYPGRLSVIAGPMCSGKTTAIADLVQCLANRTIANRFFLCCPEADERTGQVIQARNDDRKYTVHKFGKPSEIVAHMVSQFYRDPYYVLVIDDAQFFNGNELVEMVLELRAMMPRLAIALVMLDYMADGRVWPAYQSVTARLSPVLYQLTATCEVPSCAVPATRTYFVGDLPSDGVLPGFTSYFPMCEEHWRLAHERGWSKETGFEEEKK